MWAMMQLIPRAIANPAVSAAMETCMHRAPAASRPGFCPLRPSAGFAAQRRPLVGAAAGKNSQKNRGLYFEYETVDPEAAKLVPREAGEAAGTRMGRA